MKQTAVEWLFNQIQKDIIGLEFDYADEFNQAKEMEKEQKIKFANEYAESGSFYCNGEFAIEKDAEDFYNETYGGTNE